MTTWHGAKLFVEHSVGIDHDALHVIIGVFVWLLAALLLRRPVSSWQPWLWMAAVAAFNEIVDLQVERWPDPMMQYAECAKDFALTILVPGLLMLAARYRPELFRQTARRSGRRGTR